MKSPAYLNKKITLLAAILLVSFVMSLLTVYAYGALFSHNRYWNGTIKRVQEFDISLIRNLISTDIKGAVVDRNTTDLAEVFSPLNGKIYIEARINGEKIWDNNEPARKRRNSPAILNEFFETDRITFSFDTYHPPTWNSMWVRWFQDMPEWFSHKHDRITVPLLFFMGIWFSCILALIWRQKAQSESDRLFHFLEDMEELEDYEEESQ